MANIKLTQVKSRIGSTLRQKRTLDALGLTRMHKCVEKEINPQLMGMVSKVQHLLKVEKI